MFLTWKLVPIIQNSFFYVFFGHNTGQNKLNQNYENETRNISSNGRVTFK